MQGEGAKRKYSKKVYVCEFLKGFDLCFARGFSAFIEKRVHFLLHVYLVYNSRAGIDINL